MRLWVTGHISLNDTVQRLSDENRQVLLSVARDSIAYGLKHSRPIPVDAKLFPAEVRPLRATFVTLQLHGELRGCIGTLKVERPLVADVAHNAFAAALRDPRFLPVHAEELPKLAIHISVLSPPVEMTFSSEADLLSQIRPGVDGLILADGYNRGTFLPSVWEQLPKPEEFLKHLKVKAGLPPDHWSDSITVRRYTTEYFP
jgi:uncharacterized protein